MLIIKAIPILAEGSVNYESPCRVVDLHRVFCSEWSSDWVRDFSPWASSAMEATKEMKFGTKVA